MYRFQMASITDTIKTLSSNRNICGEQVCSKMTAVEMKNAELEIQLRQSNAQVAALENKILALETAQESQKIDKSMLKTCEEIWAFDPSQPSGDYWIDPDGPLTGDDPITAYCDMTTGTTIISHDSQQLSVFDDCTGVGCYRQSIKYDDATAKQLTALSRQSRACHQTFSFHYECQYERFAVYLVESLAFESASTWTDRANISRPFTYCSDQQKIGISHCDAILPPPPTDYI